MRGQFRLWPDTPQELVVPNNLLDEGEESFIKMITRDDQTDVAAAGNFYVGLCGIDVADNLTLATLVGEPTATNGYQRQAVTRNASGWPTIDLVGGSRRAATALITFTAAGGNFSIGIFRAFLCNVDSGNGGKLFSISGALPSALVVVPATPLAMKYELFIR